MVHHIFYRFMIDIILEYKVLLHDLINSYCHSLPSPALNSTTAHHFSSSNFHHSNRAYHIPHSNVIQNHVATQESQKAYCCLDSKPYCNSRISKTKHKKVYPHPKSTLPTATPPLVPPTVMSVSSRGTWRQIRWWRSRSMVGLCCWRCSRRRGA